MATAPIDIPIKVKGLSELEKVTARMEALEKEVTRLNKKAPKTANAIAATGRAAKGASGGVRTLGASFKALLGPLSIALGAIGGVSAAFNTLKQQDFAEAKFRSLGGNSKDLVGNLKALSRELQGQASTVELTGAAYDVASAGFIKAADATKILKASSLGATGGFSDINTVANATTSVLNAYGLSAANAGRLVDGFIQTQNDGKIVIGEYAKNIGKLAPIAAALNVPLEDINGAIAAVTANGLGAEIGITALRSSLAKLGANSKEATELLAGYGVEINATTIGQEGLLKTFQKLSKVTDKTDLLKIIGTEAGQAIAPLLNNLEKLERLIANQGNVAGVAAKAQEEAANTIQGAWKRLTSAVQNFFSDANEAGVLIKVVLLAAAATVELLTAAFKLSWAPVRALIELIKGVAKAMGFTTDAKASLKSFTDTWFDVLDAVDNVTAFIIGAGARIGNFLGGLIADVSGWFSGLWASITSGVQQVPGAISQAFADAFNAVKGLISNFWNGLPGWLQNALSLVGGAAGSIAGAVTSVVGKALSSVGDKVKEVAGFLGDQIGITIDVGKDFSAGSFEGLGGGNQSSPIAQTLNGGGSGGGKGKGKGGGADKAAQEAKRKREEMERQLKAAQDLVFTSENQLRLSRDMSELDRIAEEAAVKRLEIQKDYGEKLGDSKSAAETALLQVAETNELKAVELETEQALKDLREGAVQSIDEEIAALTAKIAGKEKEYEIAKKIKELEEKGVPNAAAKVNELYALRDQAAAADELKASYEKLANSISGELTGAFKSIIDGSKTAEEALADAFSGIADAFLDMAMKMIQQWIQMQIIGLVGSFFGGGLTGGGGGFGSFGNYSGLSGTPFGSFAGGGYTGDGPRSGGLDSKGGFLALLHPQETVIDHFDAARGAMGGGGSADSDLLSGDSSSVSGGSTSVSNAFAQNRSYITNTSQRSQQSETNQALQETIMQSSNGSAGKIQFETISIGGMDVVTREEAIKIGQDSAEQTRTKIFSDIKNRPAIRRQMGLA